MWSIFTSKPLQNRSCNFKSILGNVSYFVPDAKTAMILNTMALNVNHEHIYNTKKNVIVSCVLILCGSNKCVKHTMLICTQDEQLWGRICTNYGGKGVASKASHTLSHIAFSWLTTFKWTRQRQWDALLCYFRSLACACRNCARGTSIVISTSHLFGWPFERWARILHVVQLYFRLCAIKHCILQGSCLQFRNKGRYGTSQLKWHITKMPLVQRWGCRGNWEASDETKCLTTISSDAFVHSNEVGSIIWRV